MLDRVVGDLPQEVDETETVGICAFGINHIKLTLDENEHLQRIPFNKFAVTEKKICNIFGGWNKSIEKDFFGYTGKTPHFYKVFCEKSFGPYYNDIQITFNGSVNDYLFIYSGLNPNNPDNVFISNNNTYFIPANTKFNIDVKNESEPESFINGLFEFTSYDDAINLKYLVNDISKT